MTVLNTSGSSTPEPSNVNTGKRKRRLHSLLGLLLIAALAVGLLHQSTGRAQQGNDGTATPNASPAASPTVVITPAPNARELKLTFTQLNDSGVTGTTTLYDAGNRTIVDIDVKNTGANHPAHIHKGTCSQLEAKPSFDLTSVHEDGKSRSVVNASLDDLIAGGYAIDLHLSPTELGTLIVCAGIKGEPTVPGGTATAEATATAPATATATEAVTVAPRPTEAATIAAATTAPTIPVTPAATTPTTPETPTPTATVAAVGGGTGSGDGTGGTTPSGGATSTTGTTTTSPAQAIGGESSTASTTTTVVGDGTGGQASTNVNFVSTSGNTGVNSLASTGSGPLSLIPVHPMEAIIWAISAFALILFTSGIWIWRGERRLASHRQSPRWSRLGM